MIVFKVHLKALDMFSLRPKIVSGEEVGTVCIVCYNEAENMNLWPMKSYCSNYI